MLQESGFGGVLRTNKRDLLSLPWGVCPWRQHSFYNSGSTTLWHCFEIHFPSFLWENVFCLLYYNSFSYSFSTFVQKCLNSMRRESLVTSCSFLFHSFLLASSGTLEHPGDFTAPRAGPYQVIETLWMRPDHSVLEVTPKNDLGRDWTIWGPSLSGHCFSIQWACVCCLRWQFFIFWI